MLAVSCIAYARAAPRRADAALLTSVVLAASAAAPQPPLSLKNPAAAEKEEAVPVPSLPPR